MKSPLLKMSLVVAMAVAAVGCASPIAHNLPPAQQLMEPGPGVGGPGPGVLPPVAPPPPMQLGLVPAPTVQILFIEPDGLQARWDVGGVGMFDSEPLILPGRYNFPQGGIYRLKLTNIPGAEGVELYPTLEVAPTTPRTEAFLAHNAIPVEFKPEDFDQVISGNNFVTKVIYLPDPEFQEQALVGVGTLVSTRLEPGQDPIVEADRRGAIMAVVRIGNKDIEMPGAEGAGMGGMMAGGFYGGGDCGPGGYSTPFSGGFPALPGHVAGATAPQYGMPYVGTPIGLPGPPHIPLGNQAGLQSHVMRNHTHVAMPPPSRRVSVDVKANPGYSYPKPANHVMIREQNIYPPQRYAQPPCDVNQSVQ